MLVRSLGVGARGVKTDERDARVLSEVSTRIAAARSDGPADDPYRRSRQGARSDRRRGPDVSEAEERAGVGPVTAIRFVAALDESRRFTSVAQVQFYLRLTPGENSSSNRKRRTGITKAGPPAVRATQPPRVHTERAYYVSSRTTSYANLASDQIPEPVIRSIVDRRAPTKEPWEPRVRLRSSFQRHRARVSSCAWGIRCMLERSSAAQQSLSRWHC